MKTLSTFAGTLTLALATLLPPAQAQTPPSATTHDNPTPARPAPRPADHRAAKARRTKAMPDSQTLGRKFAEKSKPDVTPQRSRLK